MADSEFKKIADEIDNCIIDKEALEQFRGQCLAMAQAYRQYHEEFWIYQFEVEAAFCAINHIRELRSKDKPDQKVVKKLIKYLLEFSGKWVRKQNPYPRNEPFKPYFDPIRWIESLSTKTIELEWHEITNTTEISPDELDKAEKAYGWGIPFSGERPKNPWPFEVLGVDMRQHIRTMVFEAGRKVDWTDGRDLPAMYMLCALLHDIYHDESSIITDNMATIEPDFKPNGNEIALLIYCIREDTNGDCLSDLQKAWRYVKADVEIQSQESAGTVPNDLISLYVAVSEYHVSRSTLKRDIAGKKLKTYRSKNAPKNAKHLVSRTQIESIYPTKR